MKISFKEISNIINSENRYNEILELVKDRIKEDIHYTEKIVEEIGDLKITRINYGSLYILLELLLPYYRLKDLIELEKEDLPTKYYNTNEYDKFYDTVLEKARVRIEAEALFDEKGLVGEWKELDYKVREAIHDSYNNISEFTSEYVLLAKGPTISIKDILDTGKRKEGFYDTLEFRHATHTKDVEDLKTKVEMQDANARNTLNMIKTDSESQLGILINSGAGVNENQLAEVLNVVGFKPDVMGMVVPHPVDSSFMRGLDGYDQIYIDNIGGRKAILASKMQVKQSGYTNRKISVLTEDQRLSTIKDCGSKHGIKIEITNQRMLDLLDDRNYITPEGDIKTIDSKKDTHLIGAIINLRSPITCACDANHTCRTCYGNKTSYVNMGKNVGTLANLLVTEPMTQGLLSTKHSLKVKVQVEFPSEFSQYFTNVNNNKLCPLDPTKVFYIKPEDLLESDRNVNRYRTNTLYTYDKNDKLVQLISPVNLVIPDEEIQDIDAELYNENTDLFELSLEKLPGDYDHLFTFHIRNTGIADPLLSIKDGIDKEYSAKVRHNYNIDSYVQELFNHVVSSGIKTKVIHLEIILKCLIVFKDRSKFLDENFERQKLKDYIIYDINNAIYQSSSPVKSFMYQHTIKQLTTDSFNGLFNKSDNSEYDRLFLENIDV